MFMNEVQFIKINHRLVDASDTVLGVAVPEWQGTGHYEEVVSQCLL